MQSRKELRDLKRTLTKVRKSEEKIKNLSDEELSALTEQFKSRYSDGESLESLMPEAFAAICEADYRVLGKRPYDVQILAAAALHGGYLAEMNTGEGKTLSATMPLYLNALTGKSCMLVTTNEYLASRDGAEMGEVYNFMGLSCSYPDADDTKKQDDDEKRQFYSADIIYTTKGAMFESDYTKADKALYYVKQNCKGSYFFYEQLLADNKENTNLSADLRNVAKLLKESGSYTGALDLNYREFARIYEFVNNVGDRHNHNCYLVMVTMNTLPEQLADIEEIEKALDCMEQSIRSKIRKVDVCTRYSSMQYLIILFEPQENQIPNVMERIFMHYYELCDRENFKPQYEYIKMTEVK